MSDDSDSGEKTPPSVVKKPKYDCKYKKDWEKIYKWVAPSTVSVHHFKCRLCDKSYKGGLHEVKRHETGAAHCKLAEGLSKQTRISAAFASTSKSSQQTKEGELRLASFVAEHNLPFTVMNHLPNLIKTVCPDSKISQSFKCGRTKTKCVITRVLGSGSEEKLIAHLKENHFSLMIDESTDITSQKTLAMVARIKNEDKITKDCFLALLPVDDGSAEALFKSIKEFFENREIPYKKNMIGFAADGANTMMGAHNSVASRFKGDTEIPDIFIIKCVCHSFALCASYACAKLPTELESLMREIYSYFKFSHKRGEIFKNFQTFLDMKPHKLLHPSQTRWLSLLACVSRTVDKWDALKMFFRLVAFEDPKNEMAHRILGKLETEVIYLYLLFLNHILPYVVSLNVEMQAEQPKAYKLYEEVAKTFSTILEMFVKQDFVSKSLFSKVDYKNPRNLLPLENAYFGANVTARLLDNKSPPISSADLMAFRASCVLFYQELLDQILVRFPFGENEYMKQMSCLDPKNVAAGKTTSIIPLAVTFKKCIQPSEYEVIDREWRNLRKEELEYAKEYSFERFWNEVRKLKNSADVPLYPTLVKLVDFIGILPHSSTAVERVLSVININKTKFRNRLSTETLGGILHAKRMFYNENHCFNFKIDPALLKKMNTIDVYDFKKKSMDSNDVSDDSHED